MLGFLGFSVLPLVLLGWFLCAQVARARRAGVMRMQVTEQAVIDEVRNLGKRAAQFKAEEMADRIAAFLSANPGVGAAEVRRSGILRPGGTDDVSAGYTITCELKGGAGAANSSARPTGGAGAPLQGGPAEPRGKTSGPSRPAKPEWTHVARVPGSDLKVIAAVEDRGMREPLDRLARTLRSIGQLTDGDVGQSMERLKLMLVLGVAGLVVVLTLVCGEITRTITGPIAKLTDAAEKIQNGEREVDLEVGGGRELQLLAGAFKRSTTELRDYAGSLEHKNTQLNAAREAAVKANEELRAAQSEMLQMEKMSSLGRLVAGVAHEINTPTGAIYNVTAEAAGALDDVVAGLHRMGEMSADEYTTFRRFLDVAVEHRLDPQRVSRPAKHALHQQLEQAGVEHAKQLSELLAKCHVTEPPEAVALCRLLETHGVSDVFAALVAIHAGMKISRTSAEKISQIVRALKFYSRSGPQPAPVQTDINQTIRDALIIAHNVVKQRAEVTAELCSELPQAICTEGITEVWVNLITNACDAIEERGDGWRGEIRVRSFCSDGHVRVTVADNGRPVPPEIESKIFDPFFTTKPPGKGTGLGLSVVMGTVKRNGGSVTLSCEGDFKEFAVALPLEKPAHVSAA